MAKWVYMFTEGNANMRNLLGGKGANLALTAGVQHSSVDGVQITGFFQTGGKMSFPQERKGRDIVDRGISR